MKRLIISLMAMFVVLVSISLIAQAQETTPPAGSNQPATSTVTQTPSTEPPASTTQSQSMPTTDQSMATKSKLPKTASPLPAVAMAGTIALAAGAWLARRPRKA